jgi:hypothetical protein
MLERDFRAGGNGDGVVGAMVWWDLLNVHVRRGTLETHMRDAGLDVDKFMPGAQKAETMFHKAVRRHQRDAGKGYQVKPFPTPPANQVIYCVTKDEADEVDLTISGSTVATLTFDKLHETVTVDGTAGVTALIGATFREYVADQIVTTADLRKKIEEALMQLLGGCRIRRSGPPYYILKPYLPEVRALRNAVEKIDGSTGGTGADEAWLYLTPIHDPGDMTRSAQRGLQEELKDLAAEIAKWTDGDKRTRPDTMRRRPEENEALRNKIDMYAHLLKFKSEDLIQASRDMESAVEALIAAGDEDADEDAAA